MDEMITGKEGEAKNGGNEQCGELQSSIYDHSLKGCF